ncbi:MULTISPECIES: helix-turn-helix domain-containing protein [Cellulomonas]|uniref:Excisionase family DNA binding protein n=1 Tax=Cellulomonas oligotrophica TaxID=931536 RepID=A0A7Y9FCF1_9CELL|nr:MULTISPECIES: helix-turn-helix domain-containing protein [Cellulomonas]NYD84492.1 excisionase family DNA binding protein [Cellulomonas oligotrophica]TQL04405.1 excisionase family DNA binding protein [Cellulomonas sp. SLBN-39]GIG33866.1 transcriptional regulator [Cellulomonas oligotrophica]
MRTGVSDELMTEEDTLLTTGEVAKLLGVSRQHVVDLCDRGDLEYVTTGSHRRIRRAEVERVRWGSARMSAEQRRTWLLAVAVAGKLAVYPGPTLELARDNLRALQERHPRGQAARVLAGWEKALDGPLDAVLTLLTSPTQRAREMRGHAPFAGVLSDGEREAVLRAAR